MKLKNDQIKNIENFYGVSRCFLKTVNNFKTSRDSDNQVLRKIVKLRDEVFKLRDGIIIFSRNLDILISDLERNNFKETSKEEGNKRPYSIYEKLRASLEKNSRKDLLKDDAYSCIVFHLAEINESLVYYEKIAKKILSKKDFHPSLLFNWVVDFQVSLDSHLLKMHINDFASDGKNKKTVFSKGLVSCLGDFIKRH